MSARAAGLVACATCGKLHRAPREEPVGARLRCARCGGALHSRKPNSLQRTWALLLTGIMLYLPANIYPIMITRSLGRPEENTIISGIISLWSSGAHGVAGIIFAASVVIPIMKFFVILYLLISVRARSVPGRGQGARLYRLTEFIGPWSMVDVFVVGLLAALLDMGDVASVKPGVAAAAFAAMVVFTMLAAMAFDPRLLWDERHDVFR